MYRQRQGEFTIRSQTLTEISTENIPHQEGNLVQIKGIRCKMQ